MVDVVMSKKPSDTGRCEVVSVAVGARVIVTVSINVSDVLVNGCAELLLTFNVFRMMLYV